MSITLLPAPQTRSYFHSQEHPVVVRALQLIHIPQYFLPSLPQAESHSEG
ncbi:hypothetical protein ACRRTK_019055 [Alexandromys fortis]